MIQLAHPIGNGDTVILKELYPKIEKTFKDPANVKKLERIIAKFFDRNTEALSAAGPMKQIMFIDKDAEEFAEYCKEAGWEFVDYCKKFIIFRLNSFKIIIF